MSQTHTSREKKTSSSLKDFILFFIDIMIKTKLKNKKIEIKSIVHLHFVNDFNEQYHQNIDSLIFLLTLITKGHRSIDLIHQ